MKYVLIMIAFLLPSIASAEEPQTLEEKCTSTEASSYQGSGNHKTYVFDVENKCNFRLRCELAIAMYTSFGMKLGHKVVTIHPKSHKSIVLKLKTFGGFTTKEHHCKQI